MSLLVDVAFTPDEREALKGSLALHSLGPAILIGAFPERGLAGITSGREIAVGTGDCFMMDDRRTLRLDIAARRFLISAASGGGAHGAGPGTERA